MTVDDSAVRAERLMVGLYRMNATLPADGVLVNPPNLVDVVKTLTREAAELPPDRPLPQWLVDRGVGALVRQYVDGSLPHLAKAAARLDAAGCVNSLGSLTDQPTCDRAALPASVPEPAVWTPLWYAGETHALLIGVGLGVEEAADETGASRPLSQALRREANNSVAAAAKVLVAAGLPAVAAPTLQPTTNSLGPLELSTLHAAPAVGLSYIARRLGLASPTELGVVVLGDPSPTGGWSAVSEDLLQALASGTDVDDLIVRTGQGWERRSVGSVVSNSDSSLAGAAALLWGADWDERLTTARQQTLADAGWTWTKIVKGTPLEAPPGSEALPVVESKLATGLHHRFRMAQEYRTPAAVILGGPVATGKSVAAAQVIGRLRDTGWTILSLTTANHDLPAVDDMTAVVRSALLLSGTKPSWRTLVVLQDFYPVGATNIGEVVAGVQIAFHTHVLAIARYETTGDNDWDSGAVEHAASIVGTKALHDLATVLVREHPREYGTGRTDLNPIVRASGGDLRLLCRLLAATADRPADVDLAGLTGDMVDELLDGAPETSEAMRLLASTSLIGTWLSFNGLAPEVVRALLDKGAHRRPEGLVLSSSFLGKLILSRGENDDIHELRPTLVARLAPYLRRMLAVNEDLTVLHLVRSARAHDQELLADLLDSDGVDRDLSHWLQNADLRLAAATLLSLEFVSNRLQVVGLVTKLLANEKHSELSAGELGAILRLINKYRDNLERRPESGEPNAYAAFLERLTESGIGLRSILDRPATLSERVGVANQLARLSRQDMDALLVENTAGFLHGLKPTAEHYRLLRRLDQILERCRQDGAASPGQRVRAGRSFDDHA